MRLAALVAAMLQVAQPAHAGLTVSANRTGAFTPRAQCYAAPGARVFATSLRAAIARRDARALLALAADDIRLDFGGSRGKAELRAQLLGPEGGKFWDELAEVTRFGCAISSGNVVFPWLFAQDLGDVDPFDALVTTGPAVPLYRRASGGSAPIARLNWQLVVAQGEAEAGKPRRRVSVVGSRLEGYVSIAQLRSPIGYRLLAARQRAGWKITAFVAGD